jgi:hypothetical protein
LPVAIVVDAVSCHAAAHHAVVIAVVIAIVVVVAIVVAVAIVAVVAIVVVARRVITIIVDLSPVATCLSSSSVAVAYVISNKLMPSDVNFICLIRHLTQLIVK